MALQYLPTPLRLNSFPIAFSPASSTNATLDATGESYSWVGRVFLEGGTGTKVLFAAGGGKIRWKSASSVTFANAGTNLRVGIQDIGANGLEDGTFDVYADLVGGTDTITASTTHLTTMGVGTKTITHGDIIAISFSMTSRAGADSVNISLLIVLSGNGNGFPYSITNGTTKSSAFGGAISIRFDDGTLGWIHPAVPWPSNTAILLTAAFNLSATPDEYCVAFKVKVKMRISAVMPYVGSVNSTDAFDVIFYTEPFDTPIPIQTLQIDPNLVGGTGHYQSFMSQTLLPDIWYAVGIRPTSPGFITVGYYNLGSGNDECKAGFDFGRDIKFCARTNQSGAFVETETYHLPVFSLLIDQIDDGSGGGEVSVTF